MFSQSLDAMPPSTQGIRPFLHKIHPHKITLKNPYELPYEHLVLQPFCVPQNCKYTNIAYLSALQQSTHPAEFASAPARLLLVHRCRTQCSVFFVGASSRLELNHDLSIVKVLKLPQVCLAQGSLAAPKSSSTQLAPFTLTLFLVLSTRLGFTYVISSSFFPTEIALTRALNRQSPCEVLPFANKTAQT